jgi:hypothetical protein
MKHTVVEWLETMLENWSELSPELRKEIINHAKETERHNIIKAHGNKLKQSRGTTNFQYWYTGEDYYNDNFKNTNL